ncbi:MAG TPA: 5-methyltetrahydropteroyltriglutamate--homocysteine S-methyltransferase [Burkholderiales bacterium]|nr:5-methyltetrahydropteroyltriglutamate--homocysteine S-methyltransferase [Burkholderiales bacterium]
MSGFRVEHVGSFVRPQRLLEAVRGRKSDKVTASELKRVQDECVREIVAFQESVGLPSVTDGEFRRRSWSAGFIDAVEGFGLRDGTLTFRDATRVVGVASSPYAKAPLRRRQRIVADDYRFLKSVVKRGMPKVTMAAPDVMHYFLGPKAFESAVYRDREAFFADLVTIYREEIAELAAEGCTYLQLDDTALPCNCDTHAREDVTARGEDPDELTERYAALFNACVAGRPAGMTIGIHLCRGNLKGAWMAEGGYEPIAEALFNRVDASVYCLEYDSERAGDFSPLRFLPKGKRVILGLVSTKTPALEAKDLLKRRIDAATRHAPLEQLGLGPQCGFSSGGGGGQAVTQDDTRRKLELILETANEVWGTT